jgi:hypothetical protein
MYNHVCKIKYEKGHQQEVITALTTTPCRIEEIAFPKQWLIVAYEKEPDLAYLRSIEHIVYCDFVKLIQKKEEAPPSPLEHKTRCSSLHNEVNT